MPARGPQRSGAAGLQLAVVRVRPKTNDAQVAATSGGLGACAGAEAPGGGGNLRIICFGAHPDDCELQASGAATLWAARGHKVKFVSVKIGRASCRERVWMWMLEE